MLSHKSFSLENHKLELTQNVKQYFDYCKSLNINDNDAIILSNFASDLNSQMTQDMDKQKFIKNSINLLTWEASEANIERRILSEELSLLKEHRRDPYEKKI